LSAELFNNPNMSGEPALRRTDQHINFDRAAGDGVNQNEVSARWTGYFTPDTPGEYLVFVLGGGEEGGSRLYLDDRLVIDNWARTNGRINQVHVPLSAEAHKIRFEYFVHGSYGGPKVGIIRPDAMVSAAAKTLASRSDAVVVAVGFDSDSESEGGDRGFELPPAQNELIKQLAAANKNVIVVVTSGGAVEMVPWLDRVPALFQAWYPGQEGGTALAQMLFGEYSPSGKLPVSFERRWQDNAAHDSYYPRGAEKKVVYAEGLFLGYRHFEKAGVKPLFPFGFGLSYTTFAYKNLSIIPAHAAGDQTVADIASDSNVAVFSTANVSNLSSTNRLDAVGFGSNTTGVCALLEEGTTLPAIGPSALQHSFFRDPCGKGGNPATFGACPSGGKPVDTNNNATDFIFADVASTATIAGQHLGAPGPENLASPIERNSTIVALFLDATKPAAAAPNRVRDLANSAPPNTDNGTLSIRRRFVNNTGANVTRLRFRIVDMSSTPVPGGIADLRALTSGLVVVTGIMDTATCTATGTPATPPCQVNVQGTTLETPPSQAIGGSLNSSLAAGTITLGTPLAPGASINLQFLLGVMTVGNFKFFVNVEALP